jgi:hypothetical protein
VFNPTGMTLATTSRVIRTRTRWAASAVQAIRPFGGFGTREGHIGKLPLPYFSHF